MAAETFRQGSIATLWMVFIMKGDHIVNKHRGKSGFFVVKSICSEPNFYLHVARLWPERGRESLAGLFWSRPPPLGIERRLVGGFRIVAASAARTKHEKKPGLTWLFPRQANYL
jgi:hypothetical protein